MDWSEVGDRCFARRYEPFDVTVGAVVGADGLLVIDTRGCLGEGRELLADLRRLSHHSVRWVVNTHWHCDHCFGNAALTGPDVSLGVPLGGPSVPIYGHDSVPVALANWGAEVRDMLAERSPEYAAEMAELVIVPPTERVTSEHRIDLDGRVVELVHPGRGHTGGDLMVRVPEAKVAFAGDLIKSSGPPANSSGSFPMEWPAILEAFSSLLTPDTAVVPGHGPVVDQAFVTTQQRDVHAVAQTIDELWTSGIPEAEAVAHGEWPFPDAYVAPAVAHGYATLTTAASGG
jgi:glyoxylase-like metal-dependent hydrolase (beta-lactamase superfamily II)